jgi:hypothetical protein
LDAPSYYAIIPANVRYSRHICGNAKLLYGEISALTTTRGYCWASNATLGKLYGFSADSVSRWVKELEAAGFIVCDVIKAKGNQRRIRIVLGDNPGDKSVDKGDTKTSKRGYRQNCREAIGKNADRGIGKIAEHTNTRGSRVEGSVDKLPRSSIPPTPKSSKSDSPATRYPYRPSKLHVTFAELCQANGHSGVPKEWLAMAPLLMRMGGADPAGLERQVERFEAYYLGGKGRHRTSNDWMGREFSEWLKKADANRKGKGRKT